MPRVRSEAGVLKVSLSAIRTIAESNGAASVQEIADAAGVSVRTFHRYFPQKQDCIRPAMAEGRRLLVEAFLALPEDMPMTEAWVSSFEQVATGTFADRTRMLVRATAAVPSLDVVWEHEFVHRSADLAPALLNRVRPRGDRFVAETAATILVGLTLKALGDLAEAGEGSPTQHLRARLESIADTGLFGDTGIPMSDPLSDGAVQRQLGSGEAAQR